MHILIFQSALKNNSYLEAKTEKDKGVLGANMLHKKLVQPQVSAYN